MKKYYKVLGLVLSVVVSVLIFVFRDSFSGLQGYGLIGLFLLSVIGNATIILPAPIIFTAFIAGGVINPFLVAIVVSLGATIGELTGYLAGYGSKEIIEEDTKFKKARVWIAKYRFLALFVLAAIPNPFFDLAGIVAGATGISVKKYLLVVWLGKLVKFTAVALMGAGSLGFLNRFM